MSDLDLYAYNPINEGVKILNLFTCQPVMLPQEIEISFQIFVFVKLYLRVLSADSHSISISADVGKKLHLL